MKNKRPHNGPDGIDEHVRAVVLEQVAYFQTEDYIPLSAMDALLGAAHKGSSDVLLWADVAGLIEDIYREDQGLPAKCNHKYSVPRYKNGYPI